MASPKITIAIVSHDQQDLVEELLTSLESVSPAGDFKIVLLENVPGTERQIQNDYSFPIKYILNEKEQGYSVNLNQISESVEDRSEYFCILNPDIRFVNNVFPILLRSMEEHEVDIIAPLMRDSAGMIQDSFRDVPSPTEVVLRFAGLREKTKNLSTLPEFITPDWIAAMFLLMPFRVFESLGGFDERYRLYFEDVDFSLRARQAGYRIGVDKSVHVLHDAQRTSHKNIRFLWRHFLSAILFFTSSVYRAEKRIRTTP